MFFILMKWLYKIGLTENPKCSFCKNSNENIYHLFYECSYSKKLWRQIKLHCWELNFPELSPESAFLGFVNVEDTLVNLIYIIFKITLYKNRQKGISNINQIISKVRSFKIIEQNITLHDPRKRDINSKKWEKCPEVRLAHIWIYMFLTLCRPPPYYPLSFLYPPFSFFVLLEPKLCSI